MTRFETSDGANAPGKKGDIESFNGASYLQDFSAIMPKMNTAALHDVPIVTANGGPAYCTDLSDAENCPFVLPDAPQSTAPTEQGPRETIPKFKDKERPGHDSAPGNPLVVPPVIQQEIPKTIGRPRREPTSTNPFRVNEIRV